MDSYDLIVIGAGPGGYVAAIRGAQLGLKTALIEKDAALGGTCLNVGCIPSKALLESSELVSRLTHEAAAHGIATGPVSFDVEKMVARKAGVVKELTEGISFLMKKNKVTVLSGRGELAGPGRVRVHGSDGVAEVAAKHALIATGSVPIELPNLPFDGAFLVSSTEALAFDAVPQRLAVVGGGAIGLELGSVWARLGAEVTVIEMMPRLVPFADPKLAKLLERSLKGQGMAFKLNHRVTGATVAQGAVTLALVDAKDKTTEIVADKVLVAVGRKPFTEGLGLESVGITLDERGRVPVDDHGATSAPGVWAIGDVVRGPMLAHKAEEEGIAAVERMAGKGGHVNLDAIPNVVYTHPELAQVGLTEDQAKERGHEIAVGTFAYRANGRAKSMGESEGQVKIIADASSDRLLGVHILGARASELIAEATLALEFGASAEDLARTCHAHPTLSEIVKEAAMAVDGRAIHA